MKFNKCLFALLALAVVMTAKVSAISYDASVDGLSAPDGVVFTASSNLPATLELKSKNGWTVLGVKSGYSDAEIAGKEALTVTFDAPLHYSSLTFGLLFNGPEFGDIFEIAAALTDGSSHVYTLKALTDTTAIWDGSVNITAISAATRTTGGVWEVANPFGSLAVTSLKLYAINSPEYNASTAPHKSDSDFGLVAFNAPDAASTVALLGASILSMCLMARRKR